LQIQSSATSPVKSTTAWTAQTTARLRRTTECRLIAQQRPKRQGIGERGVVHELNDARLLVARCAAHDLFLHSSDSGLDASKGKYVATPTIHPAKNVLLTGAGFTKPFRGYLASEMWALILSQPEICEHPNLRQCLLGNLNFEVVYDLISKNESNEYKAEARKAFVIALEKAYKHLHDATSKDFQPEAYQLCRVLLSRFGHVKNDEVGVAFTLNQDLLVERHFSAELCNISIPGVRGNTWFRARHSEGFEVEPVKLPSRDEVETIASSFWSTNNQHLAYFKLHGSMGWRSTYGYESMIVGTTKTSAIEREPLLRWYSSVLKQVLHAGDRNLLVIGYGFRDPHINAVIAEGISEHRLRLFVVSPHSPEQFRVQLIPHGSIVGGLPPHQGGVIWEGLAGYYAQSTERLLKDDWNLSADGEMLAQRLQLA
jgi:hypothetical protein